MADVPEAKTSDDQRSPFRVLPQLSSLLQELNTPEIASDHLATIIRTELGTLREEIKSGARFTSDEAIAHCRAAVEAVKATRFDEVINGTGIILHTNLGRAPVSEATAQAMASAADSYLSLEIDPNSNRRGGRMEEIARLLRVLTSAEAALVVNNNAAAVLLTLSALCGSRDLVVSRGEAVEIGGGFRIPEVVAQSGCRLIEVGTTNRTYGSDYIRATTDATSAFLRVHRSNFQVEGFVNSPSTSELAAAAHDLGVCLIEDLGSGALLDTAEFGLRHEPTIDEVLSAGADVVTFSGDKLLGGPQVGIICGRADLIQQVERHPLARAVRADKTALAGVAATLRHYLAGDAVRSIPIWRMIGAPTEELWRRGSQIVADSAGELVQSVASVGAGSLPGETLASVAIRLETRSADDLARSLRTGRPRVFSRIHDGAVLIDVRTVQPRQDGELARAIRQAVEQSA